LSGGENVRGGNMPKGEMSMGNVPTLIVYYTNVAVLTGRHPFKPMFTGAQRHDEA